MTQTPVVSTDAFREVLAGLSAEYRSGLPARMAELDELWTASQGGAVAPQTLRRALHSIAGSAQTFGLAEVTAAARAAEQKLDACCDANAPIPEESKGEFEILLQALKSAVQARPLP